MSTSASRRPGPASRRAGAARVLYLSYDGMCDPLGASQVLPYVTGLAARGHAITLVSFEKPARTAAERSKVQRACDDAGIAWRPMPYHKRPPILSTMFDIGRMRLLSAALNRECRFDVTHCRSYLPALVGLHLKRRHGVRFLFDMRGFWADERVDGRIWNLANPILRAVFNFFKRREADFLREADHIISLTAAGKNALVERRLGAAKPPITVIPCCVDFQAFRPIDARQKVLTRQRLGIPAGATVAAYLGSFGSWYMVAEMLAFFRVQLQRDPEAIFLIVSREPEAEIRAIAESHGVPGDRVIVQAAAREEVPALMSAADYGLFFIQPVFSKIASSPTKMGELLALELPMITNGDVGDVASIIAETGAGIVIRGFDDKAYGEALDELAALEPDMARWRPASRRWFDLENAVERYDAIYRELTSQHAG